MGELFALTEPWQRPAQVPQQPRALASKQQLEPSDESWVLDQQEIRPCTPLLSHHLVLFLIPADRQNSGNHQPPRLQNPAGMRKLCLLTSLPGLGKGNINGHFTSLLHISVLFPVLYFIVKARLILLFDGTRVTNSAYPVGFSGRENIIGIFFSTQ